MTPGDVVVVLEDPLNLGKLLILSVEDDGKLLCEALHADDRGDYYRDKFAALELELFDVWDKAVA